MATYETAQSVDFGRYDNKPVEVMATPQSTLQLAELAEASKDYAGACETFVAARNRLTAARERWNGIRDQVAKAIEQEGV